MLSLPRFPPLLAFSIALAFSSSLWSKTKPLSASSGWDEIPQEELDATEPRIDPDAHAEFLYRWVEVDDGGSSKTYFEHHNRVKIFTEAGVADWDKVDIVYGTGSYIKDLKARIIYPDQTVVDLKREDVFSRRLYKDESFEGKAKSFSFPGLVPGCIVEYKWVEVRKYWTFGFELPLLAELPTWRFGARIKPYRGFASETLILNSDAEWEKKKAGFNIELLNQPAYSTEPYLAARKDFEPYICVNYATEIAAFSPLRYWALRGGALADTNRSFIKAKDKEIRRVAETLFEGKFFNDEKLRAAYDFCVNEITNISEYTDAYTEEEIEALKENTKPSQTIKNGYGTRYDINAVFASLAAAAGFTVGLAQIENHREFSYNINVVGTFNLSDWVVAIRDGATWRYFDPGSGFLPFEVLNPNNSDADGITTEGDKYFIFRTPKVADDFSKVVRKASVSINEFGDLEGQVEIEYNGYAGLWRKRMFSAMTNQEIKDYLQAEEWQNRLPRSVIEAVKVTNADSRAENLTIQYDLEIPAYADVLDNRILLNPNLFENGNSSPFTSDERKEPIAFDYVPCFLDVVLFKLPEGYRLEGEEVTERWEGSVTRRKSWLRLDSERGGYLFERGYLMPLRRIDGSFYPLVKKEFSAVAEADSKLVSFRSEIEPES